MTSNIKNNYVVIMAGGVGSRFWPYSRKNFPKQFHDVLGIGQSLLQLTAQRFDSICLPENIYVVTNSQYKSLVKEQLPYLSDDQILLEPEGRNTAPCIAYASYKIHQKNPDASIVICPSDHIILKENTFKEKIETAITVANEGGNLVTLGITPTRPDTGYGYIQFEKSDLKSKEVKRFAEKPSLEIAKVFVSNGDYVWNAGIFVWKSSTIITAFNQYLPQIGEVFEEAKEVFYTKKEQEYINSNFSRCDEISIDYGIMEKAKNVYVILSDIGWSDLGTWKSLYEVKDKDQNGNVVDGDVILYNTTDSIIKTPKDKLVVINGVKNLIVAEYDGVLLICNKDDEQKVKNLVGDVKKIKGEGYY